MYKILVSNYGATGEGETICILITRAYPMMSDYDENHTLKNNAEFRAMREFGECFDEFYAKMYEFVEVEDLLKQYSSLLPPIVVKVLSDTSKNGPGNFNFFQQFHINYS
jgi:hypothetical protein